jgi:1-acyl-sn-glycerol-3-phosphate acyltransferase
MVRLALISAVIATVTVALIPLQWLSVALRLPTRRSIPTAYHRMICALLGVRIATVGARHPGHPLLVVANHSSWLDISVITAVAPVVFVAKREVSTWPLFGLLARLQRTVFVDRTRRQTTQDVNAEIAARLAQGDPVVLFGEGTSSDGNRVLPFRSALIGAARDVLDKASHVERVLIQPLSIAYTGLHGLPLGRRHRPAVSWYGGMDLLPHLGNIMRKGALDAVVSWGEPVAYGREADRKVIARTLETAVRRMTVATLRRSAAGQPNGGSRPSGHSNPGGKPVQGRTGGTDRTDGMPEAAECRDTRPQPEWPQSTPVQPASTRPA